MYDDAHERIVKRRDETDRINLDRFFKLKINMRRFKSAIKYLLKRSRLLGVSIHDVRLPFFMTAIQPKIGQLLTL